MKTSILILLAASVAYGQIAATNAHPRFPCVGCAVDQDHHPNLPCTDPNWVKTGTCVVVDPPQSPITSQSISAAPAKPYDLMLECNKLPTGADHVATTGTAEHHWFMAFVEGEHQWSYDCWEAQAETKPEAFHQVYDPVSGIQHREIPFCGYSAPGEDCVKLPDGFQLMPIPKQKANWCAGKPDSTVIIPPDMPFASGLTCGEARALPPIDSAKP